MSNAGTPNSIVERVVERVTTLVVERPKRMLLAGLLLFAVLLPGVGRVYQNIKYYIWFPAGDSRIAVLDDFEQRFGSDLASMIVVHSPSGIFDKESAKLVIELTDRMWKVAETIRVESLSNFSWIHAQGDEIVVEPLIPDDRELTDELLAERRAAALSHEQLPGFLISKDGTTAVIYGYLQPTSTGQGDNVYNDFVTNNNDLKKLVAEFEGRGDHEFYLSGFPVVEGYLEVYPPQEMQQLTPIILATVVLLLFVFFRRASGVLLPLAVAFPSVLGTLGVAGWLGIPINPMTITTPNIMIIVAISSSDNMLFAYFRALDSGLERKEAVRYALRHNLWPTFFSALMIGIGFLSLITMTIPPMQDLGILVGLGSMLVFLLVCLVLAPLTVILPIRRKRRRGTAAAATPEDLSKPRERATRLTAWIDRYKVAILAGWIGLLGLSVWLAAQNRMSFDPIEWYDESTYVRKGLDFLREKMGSSESFEIVIDSGAEEGIKDPAFMRKVDEFGTWLKAQDKVIQVTSVVDILKETNRALYGGAQDQYKLPDTRRGIADQYLLYTFNLPMGKSLNDRVTLGNDALRMSIFTRLENSPKVMAFADRMAAKARELGLKATLTGRNLLYHQLQSELVPSFFRSMVSGTIMIGIILLIVFRSLRLGLLSLATNFIPIIVGGGIGFFLLGKAFDMATIAVFVIALGVSVDDTVHFLDGYVRSRRQGFSPRDSITRLWTEVGPAMFFTTIVLTACFALFLTITFPILRDLGGLIALILIVAFLADFFLGPALLMLWPGKGEESRRDE
jgi:predicted RND superfamily exporter protein